MRGFKLCKRILTGAIGFVALAAMCLAVVAVKPQDAMADTSENINVSSSGIITSKSPFTSETSEITGPSNDFAAISDTAEQYEQNDAASAVNLAESASSQETVPLKEGSSIANGPKQYSTETAAGRFTADNQGTLTSTSPTGISVSINSSAQNGDTQLVNGSLVSKDVENSTSLVTSATDTGIQSVVILANSSASNNIPFSYDLPAGAILLPQTDGSILVKAPVTTQVASQSEVDRFNASVKSITGDINDPSQLTDEQIQELAKVPAEKTEPVTTIQTVSTVASPWAIDANGGKVPTHYVINGNSIIQIVETTPSTAFPVTADPSWVWWVGTAASCAAGVVSFAVAVAKVPGVAARLNALVRSSAALAKAVKALGGAKNTLTTMLNVLRGAKLGRNAAASLRIVENIAGKALLAALGVDGCWALFKRLVG